MDKKNILLLAVGILIAILAVVLAIFFITRKPDPERGFSGHVQIEKVGDWRIIQYLREDVFLAIPSEWDFEYQPILKKGMRAYSGDPSSTYSNLSLYIDGNEKVASPSKIKEKYPFYDIQIVYDRERGALRFRGSYNPNAYYEGEAVDADYDNTLFINETDHDNYFIGRALEHDMGVVYFECTTQGPRYKEHIEECDKIVGSLTVEPDLDESYKYKTDIIDEYPLLSHLPHYDEEFEVNYSTAKERPEKIHYNIVVYIPAGVSMDDRQGYIARAGEDVREWLAKKGFTLEELNANWIIK